MGGKELTMTQENDTEPEAIYRFIPSFVLRWFPERLTTVVVAKPLHEYDGRDKEWQFVRLYKLVQYNDHDRDYSRVVEKTPITQTVVHTDWMHGDEIDVRLERLV